MKFDDLFKEREPPPSADVISFPPANGGGTTAYGRAAMEDELEILGSLPPIPNGRNHQLNTSMFKIARLVAGGQVEEAEAVERFRATARAIGLNPGEIEGTLRSAINGGKKNPRAPAPRYEEVSAEPLIANGVATTAAEGEERERTSWWPKPIAERAAEHASAPVPTHLRREDGNCLMYRERVNGIIGESESGKSWIALLAIKQAAELGQRVLILDFEDSPNSVYQRLVSLELTAEVIANVHYADPDESLDVAQQEDLKEALGNTYDVILVDGVNAAMTLLKYNLESNTDATLFFRFLLRPLASTGACVITVDHVPKNPEQRGKGGIGAQAKRAMVNGCQLTAEVEQPFGKGQSGTIKLTVDKDRNGAVRGISGGGRYAGKAHIVSIQEIVQIHIGGPDLRPQEERDWKPTGVMEQVSKFLERQEYGVSLNTIKAGVTARDETTKLAISALEEGGFIRLEDGPRRSVLHFSKAPYREKSGLVPTDSRLVPGIGEVDAGTDARLVPPPFRGNQSVGPHSRGTENDQDLLTDSGTSQIPPGTSACNQCGEHVFDAIIEATGGYCVACGRDQ